MGRKKKSGEGRGDQTLLKEPKKCVCVGGGTDDRQLDNATHSPVNKQKKRKTNQLAKRRLDGPGFQLLNGDWRIEREREEKKERDDKCRDQRNPQKNKRRRAAEKEKTKKERREKFRRDKRKGSLDEDLCLDGCQVPYRKIVLVFFSICFHNYWCRLCRFAMSGNFQYGRGSALLQRDCTSASATLITNHCSAILGAYTPHMNRCFCSIRSTVHTDSYEIVNIDTVTVQYRMEAKLTARTNGDREWIRAEGENWLFSTITCMNTPRYRIENALQNRECYVESCIG